MANIDKELNDIKNAVYGREVRGSIHDGIKKINEEVEDSTETSEQAKHQVENIQEQVDNLVVSGDSSVEAAQARVDKDNHNYSTLKERLDTEQQQFETQLAEVARDSSNYTLALEPKSSLYDSVFKTYKKREELKGKNEIRVATFNVRTLREDFYGVLSDVKKKLLESKSSLLGLQEMISGPYLVFEENLTSEAFPHGYFYSSVDNYRNNFGFKYGNGIVSSFDLIDKSGHKFEMIDDNLEQRTYQRCLLNVDGVLISVYNTHLTSGKREEIKNQLNQLFNIVENDPIEKNIIVGDFNTDIMSEFEDFKSAGYSIANENEYYTYKGAVGPNFESNKSMIDNIIVSSNLSITNVGMINSDYTSDHNILFADIKII